MSTIIKFKLTLFPLGMAINQPVIIFNDKDCFLYISD